MFTLDQMVCFMVGSS